MWTDTVEGQSFIKEISRSVIIEVAPEEMELFDEMVQEYFKNPLPPNLTSKTSDDPLGFGLGEAVIVVTPAIAAAVKAILEHLLGQTFTGIKEEGATAIRSLIKKRLNPEKKDVTKTPVDFSKDDLATVRRIATAEAKKFGLSNEDAEKFSGVLIGKLALA